MHPGCFHDVPYGNGYHSRKCKNIATVQREGHWWCSVHDPEKKAAKREVAIRRHRFESETRLLERQLSTELTHLAERCEDDMALLPVSVQIAVKSVQNTEKRLQKLKEKFQKIQKGYC